MRTHTAAILPLLALLALPARADMALTGAIRELDAAVADQHAFEHDEGLGYFAWSGFMTEHNDLGATTAKIEHESLTRDNLIKSTTTFTLNSVAGSPGTPASGSSINSSFAFTLSQRTTFELLFSAIDASETIDAFNLSITDADGASFFNLSENRQVQGLQLITLDAGSYTLGETSGITGVAPESAGRWSYTTSFIFRAVPAPSTLAVLTAPALLLTRKRRR